MHYKNGREAKNGDKVVFIPGRGPIDRPGEPGTPVIGILYDTHTHPTFCSGKIALIRPQTDANPDLKECLHVDDVLKALPSDVPDSSKAE